MRTLYLVAIVGIILLGIAHSTLTFKKYNQLSAEAFWFFSAGLALVFAGLANSLYYQLQMPVTFRYTLAINVLLVLFTVFLAIKVTVPTTILVAVFSILLCVTVLYNQ
jgi:putative membrane protein